MKQLHILEEKNLILKQRALYQKKNKLSINSLLLIFML